jgi:hypothetical protein
MANETLPREIPVVDEDWMALLSFLPEGWREKAIELGAFTRRREFRSPEDLLRAILIHVAEGYPLDETATRVSLTGLANVSGVDIMKRLRNSEGWLHWMTWKILESKKISIPQSAWAFRPVIVDATSVSKPGSRGTDWRLHYALELKTLGCSFFSLASSSSGENLQRFPVRKKDLFMGDRAYAGIKGIRYVLQHGGDVLIRCKASRPGFMRLDGSPFDLLGSLRTLEEGEVGEWRVLLDDEKKDEVKGRICAVKRSRLAAELALEELLQDRTSKGSGVSEDAMEASGYIFVFTTVGKSIMSKEEILELYRARWQIEMCFKRLKSIVGFGNLPNQNPQSCRAWLYGKLLVALLAEKMIETASSFSPWGYCVRGE